MRSVIAENGEYGQYCASMTPSQAARAAGWLTCCSSLSGPGGVSKSVGYSGFLECRLNQCNMYTSDREAKNKIQGVGTTMVVHEGAGRSSQWCSIACAGLSRYQIIGYSRDETLRGREPTRPLVYTHHHVTSSNVGEIVGKIVAIRIRTTATIAML